MAEFADHAVTLQDGMLRVNLLLSGKYSLVHEGRAVAVEVATRYPEAADTVVQVTGADETLETRIRIPPCIASPEVRVAPMPGGVMRYTLSGRVGHRLEEAGNGAVLRYGPLVMAPLRYSDVGKGGKAHEELKGYIPEAIRQGRPAIVPGESDAGGFARYPKEPYPVWENYEEGALSRLAFDGLSVNVPLAYPDGSVKEQRFYPECYSTTTLIGGSGLPVVFGGAARTTEQILCS